MVFAWEAIQSQARITGKIEKLPPAESDILFNKYARIEDFFLISGVVGLKKLIICPAVKDKGTHSHKAQ